MRTSSSRILALDLLRGYFLCVIIIDHLARFPSLFDFLTGRGELWSSAAEGFFIISGLVMGRVYGNKFIKNHPQFWRDWRKRLIVLYFSSITLTLFFSILGELLQSHPGVKPDLLTPFRISRLLLDTLSLEYTYGWADFLGHYALLLLPVPVVFFLVKKGWSLFVFLGSGFIWFLRGASFELAWQILFIPFLVIGYHLPILEEKWITLPHRFRQLIFYTLLVTSVISVFTSSYFVLLHPLHLNKYYLPWFDKDSLGLGRVILSILWFTTLYISTRRYEKNINQLTRGFLSFLGRHSLTTYIIHALLIYLLRLLLFKYKTSFSINTLLGIIILFLTYLIVWLISHKPLAAGYKRFQKLLYFSQ